MHEVVRASSRRGARYYDTGFGGQEFSFVSCIAAAAMADAGAEPLTEGERRGMRTG